MPPICQSASWGKPQFYPHVQVELCKAFGDPSKPRAWSKHTQKPGQAEPSAKDKAAERPVVKKVRVPDEQFPQILLSFTLPSPAPQLLACFFSTFPASAPHLLSFLFSPFRETKRRK